MPRDMTEPAPAPITDAKPVARGSQAPTSDHRKTDARFINQNEDALAVSLPRAPVRSEPSPVSESRAEYMRAWRARQRDGEALEAKPGSVTAISRAVTAIVAALEPLELVDRQRALDAVVAILG